MYQAQNGTENPAARPHRYRRSAPPPDIVQPVVVVAQGERNPAQLSGGERRWRRLNAPPPDVVQNVQIVGQNGATAVSAAARALVEAAGDSAPLFLKEADYSDDLAEAEDAERPTLRAFSALTNEEMFRIIREVAVADSGDALYPAVATDADYQANGAAAGRQFGLSFGLALFTQESGRLGSVLRLMQKRDAALFAQIFGPDAEALLTTTNAPTAAERLMPVAGEPLSSPTWVERFKRAGAEPLFQAAQNEEAIEGQFRPALRGAMRLGLSSDRALAMVYDRVVTKGLGGGLRWVIETAGPLKTNAQRTHALAMLGFNDPAQFQAAVGLPPSGRFTHETHAALVDELRKRGEATLPSPDEMAWRLYVSATGAAKLRLRRLLDSAAFTDVVYGY